MPRAGALKERVAFQSASKTPDGGGGNTDAWATQFTCWGSLLLPRGREALEAGRLEDTASGKLRVRKSSETEAVTAAYRAVITRRGAEALTFSITSTPVDPYGTNQWLEMNVEHGAGT